MKVAYWPGCVSRGFTPELHGSMAQRRAAARHRARRARPRVLLRRRRHRRAQPGARRHAQRPHLRARPAGRGRRADDEHLLDLPGRADRVPGAPRRERRVPRAHQREPRRRGPDATRRASSNKNFLWLLVEEIGLDELRSRVKRPLTNLQGRPVLRLLHRAPDRPAGHRRRAPARHVPRAGHRGARRHGHRVRGHAQVLRLPDHHDEQGRPRSSRPAATSATRSTPRPTAS